MAPADPQGPIGVHRLSLALTAIVAQIRQAPDQGSRRRTSARRSAPAAGSFRARGQSVRCGNAWRDHGSSGTIRPTSGRRRSARIVEKEKPDCEATDFHIVLEPSPIEPNKMNKSIVRPDPNPLTFFGRWGPDSHSSYPEVILPTLRLNRGSAEESNEKHDLVCIVGSERAFFLHARVPVNAVEVKSIWENTG